MNPSRRRQSLNYKKHITTTALTWAGCSIVLFFAYLLLLAPQNKIKKNIEEELSKAKQKHQSALNATRDETQIQLKKEIEQLQNTLKNFVIDFEDSANLTFDISRIASELGLDSFSIKTKAGGVSKIPDCEYIGESKINISFAGRFDQFTAFLSALERHQPVVFVDEFRVTQASDKKGAGNRVSMSVAVFVKKQQRS